MPEATSPEQLFSRLLDDVRRGDRAAMEKLVPLVYDQLHDIASRQMRQERENHTLQPTALVHEAFLRLTGGEPISFDDRAHFLRTASQTMRRVLVDHARARQAAKRGGALRVTLDEQLVAVAPAQDLDLLALDDALVRLGAAEPRCAQVVELRFFAGLEVTEAARVLGVSPATVKRDWQFAKAWLERELRHEHTA
jgi:RNA polymerase sigma-70 factor, ECF subfamily